MSHQLLTITAETIEDARLVRVAGEVDASSVGELRRHLERARADGATVLLDLAEVSFMDSTGLHVLLENGRLAAQTGWSFFIVRPSRTVQRLIRLTASEADLPLVRAGDRVLA